MSEDSLRVAGTSKAPIDYRNRQGGFSNSALEFDWLSTFWKPLIVPSVPLPPNQRLDIW